jgi:predicted lysophospholipase L1 biosynthesis ABC-type transport system permease subunit
MEASLLDEGLSKAMWLNTLTLILFTASLFFVLIQFILRKRLEDFQVLRTLGFSQRQGWFVLHIEFFSCLLLGLSAGTILGLGFFFILFAYMTEALASVVINPPVVNWWALAGLDTLLLFLFGAALLLPRIRMSAHELWIALHDNE